MTDKISPEDRALLRLVERSKGDGEGWRQVNSQLWPLVLQCAHPDLTELDHKNKRIRFTPEGTIVMRYLG